MTRVTNISNSVLSFLIPICLTVFFNLIFFPILNSGDDAFAMFTLAGGYGEEPTNLVQYHHAWHYILGGLVVFLFRIFPDVNWYTVILLVVHLAGMILFLNVLLKRQPKWTALLLFFTGFLFIESRFLLSPNFSNTAFTGATGALAYLFHQWEKREWRLTSTITTLVVLILAVMLRLHMVLFAIALFIPILLLRIPLRRSVKGIGFLISFILASFLLYKLQQNYYQQRNPGWNKQEEFRQNLFYGINRPVDPGRPVFKNAIEKEKFFTFYMYDTAGFNSSRVKEITHGLARNARLDKKDMAGLYWFFLDLRIYILLFAAVLVYARVRGQKKIFLRWLPALGIYLVIQVLLFLFLKSTMNIHLGLLLYLWIQLCLSLEPLPGFDTRKLKNIALVALWGVLCIWMGWRLYKEDRANRKKNNNLQCTLAEIRAHPGNLFIVFGDIFYLSHFSVWDLPARHSLANVLYKDRMITFTYPYTMQQFGISNLDSSLEKDERVLLIGEPRFLSTGVVDGFKCTEVRKVK